MKITLNLAPAESLRDRYALAWTIPAAIIGLTGLILICNASVQGYRQYNLIQVKLAAVEARAADLHNREDAVRRKLEDPAYRNLLQRTRYVNELIERRKVSVSEISARIVSLLPEEAHLTELALASPKRPGEGYAVRIGVAAKNEDAVEAFMNKLADTQDFKDASITNQGFQEEISQPDQVNIVCTAQYRPEVKLIAEKSRAEESTPSSETNR